MTPEDRAKAIQAGTMLAMGTITITIQSQLDELTDDELRAGYEEQTAIIENPLATPASVIAAAAKRWRLATELILRNTLRSMEDEG